MEDAFSYQLCPVYPLPSLHLFLIQVTRVEIMHSVWQDINSRRSFTLSCIPFCCASYSFVEKEKSGSYIFFINAVQTIDTEKKLMIKLPFSCFHDKLVRGKRTVILQQDENCFIGVDGTEYDQAVYRYVVIFFYIT